MSTTLLSLAVDEIGAHPKNVRRDDTPDAELIASVESQGILQPLVVVPAPEDAPARYWLIMGHRRLAAAQAARLMEVPAIVREDLDGEAEQIEAMLVENGRRQDLTAVEEADAYQQLTLLGIDVDEISKTTGRASSTVRSRLKIAGMATSAKEALHGHQITLEQAERLVGLEENKELYAEVVATIGTNDFKWKLDSAERRLEQFREAADLTATFEAAGLQQVEEPEGGWGHSWKSEDSGKPIVLDGWLTKQGTPGVDFDGWTMRGTVPCGVRSAALRAKLESEKPAESDEQREERLERERRQAEWDEQRKVALERKEQHEAAATVRTQTIRDTFASVSLTAQQTDLLRVLAASLFDTLSDSPDGRRWLVEHDGLEHDGNHWTVTTAEIFAHFERKTAVQLLTLLARLGAEGVEWRTEADKLEGHEVAVGGYLDALVGAGHELSTPDREWLDAVTAPDEEA